MTGRGEDINAILRLPAGVLRLRPAAAHRLSTASPPRSAVWSRNTGEFFNADQRPPGRAVGADHGRQQPVPDHRAAQPGARGRVQGAAGLRAPESPRAAGADRLRPSAPTRWCARWSRSPPELTRTFGYTEQLAPQFRALFDRLGPTVTASERGLPALDRILSQIPPLLAAFEPFLRNADPMVRYIARVQARDHRLLRQRHRRRAGVRQPVAAERAGRPFTTCGPPRRSARTARVPPPAAGQRSRQRLPDPRRLQPARHRAGGAQPQPVLQRQPGAPDERHRLEPARAQSDDPEPARVAQLIQRYVFRSPGREVASAAVQGPGNDPRLLDFVPAAARRPAAGTVLRLSAPL